MTAAARTACVGIITGLAVLLGLPLLILWTSITGNPDLMYRTSMSFCRFAIRLLGVRVRIEGIEGVPARACIFAANHASNLDPPILLSSLRERASIFVKKELFRVPIFASGMRAAGFIPVDRGGGKALAGLPAAIEHLKKGLSVVVFPEGTRSPDGRLQSFKRGAFAVAIESGVAVVPVGIAGTQRLLRRGAWVVHPGEVTLRFGAAIDASQYAIKQSNELLARVESAIVRALPLEQRAGDPGAAGSAMP